MPFVEGKDEDMEFAIIRHMLIGAAHCRQLLNYQHVAYVMGLGKSGNKMSKNTGQMLAQICRHESEDGRPMLSAVVIQTNGSKPGKGFFKLAREVGKLGDDSKDAERPFWEQEKAAVFKTWAGRSAE